MRTTGWLLALVFLRTWSAEAANIQAAGCNSSQVESAIKSANNGDTVVIPSGTCTWSSPIFIDNKSITLQGAGVNATTIVDGITAPLSNAKPAMLQWKTTGNLLTRITGITFDGNTVGGIDEGGHSGIVAISGSGTKFRLDHAEFRNLSRTVGVQVTGSVTGVIDHVVFNVGSHYGIYIFHDNWLGVGGYGDNSWAQPNAWGTAAFLFVEDCQFVSPSGNGIIWGNDGWMGQRVVYRRNTYTNALWANHGTETSGRERSARAAEVYQNTFVLNNTGFSDQLCCLNSVIGVRGGTALIWDNNLTATNGGGARQVFDMANLRSNDPRTFFLFSHCDGSNQWDQNAGPQPGYRCIDQPGAGQGDLLSGDTPSARWPRQKLEPLYVWNNLMNGVLSAAALNGVIPVVANRDFYTQVNGFNGSEGMGRGPISARPSSCTTGVGYWAVDEGEWDSTNGAAPDGRLYLCTGTNQWTLAYTPYPYPHPLVSGVAQAPPEPPRRPPVPRVP